jgi:hypothetical protein
MIEALKLALKWAEKHGEVVFDGGGMIAVDSMTKWQNAVKEAIAELESQEPLNQLMALKEMLQKQVDRLIASNPQRTEQNFCSRCGKRTTDLTTIHTCTPPQD